MTQIAAWGATAADSGLGPLTIERRDLRADDVAVEIAYCGVCHSDLHTTRNDWHMTRYPIVPGHEITGRVTAVGLDVTKFKVGDRVAVGTVVGSCRHCHACESDLEQYCVEGSTETFGAVDKIDGTITQGGYSKSIVAPEHFVLRVPEGLDLARAAPLLCAGATTWSPLRHWKVGPGSKVGVIGLGGLGHMGVKLAKGLGADVTVFTSSAGKAADAQKLGADHVILSSDQDAMQAAMGRFDFLLDTIPVAHDLSPYLPLLTLQGTICLVGAIDMLPSFHSFMILANRRSLAGSGVAGIAETQELLDFCAEKNILPECEMIRMDQINDAFARMEKADVKYRFVIDMATL